MTRHLKAAAALGVALLALGGCNDSSVPGSRSLSVTPSLGKIYNTDVEVRCMATGLALGSGSTGSTGVASITLNGTCAGPVLIEIAANGGSTYYDESLANTVALPLATSLRAIVPSLSGLSSVGITALTEIAAAQALQVAGGVEANVTALQASTANSNVVTQVLGGGVTLDILVAPSLWDSNTAAGSLGDTAADRYAYFLAALAKMNSSSGTPALAVLNALSADLADGTLDGTGSGDFVYTSGDLATQLDTAQAALASFANSALAEALGLGGGGGGGGGGDCVRGTGGTGSEATGLFNLTISGTVSVGSSTMPQNQSGTNIAAADTVLSKLEEAFANDYNITSSCFSTVVDTPTERKYHIELSGTDKDHPEVGTMTFDLIYDYVNQSVL